VEGEAGGVKGGLCGFWVPGGLVFVFGVIGETNKGGMWEVYRLLPLWFQIPDGLTPAFMLIRRWLLGWGLELLGNDSLVQGTG